MQRNDGSDSATDAQPLDARKVLTYLVVPESDQYIAIMDVLEASITDLTPSEICVRLQAVGRLFDEPQVEARLDQLREWAAVSVRTDSSRILRYAGSSSQRIPQCFPPLPSL